MTLRRTTLTRAPRSGSVRPAVVAAVGVLGVLAAGCSSSPSSSPAAGLSSAATSAPASASAPSGAASSPGASSAGAGTAAAAGGAPACATRDLKATAGVAQGAAGSVYQVINFTNIGGSTCTLFGYPGVSLAAGTPVAQVGAAASRSSAAPASTVTLTAGATANALLRITQALNYPASSCKPVATSFLQIYPPNQTTPIYLAYKTMGCSSAKVNILSVGVVKPGKGSGQ